MLFILRIKEHARIAINRSHIDLSPGQADFGSIIYYAV